MRDLEFHAAFNAGPATYGNPNSVWTSTPEMGSHAGFAVWCLVRRTSAGFPRGIQAVREHRDLLSNMEMMRKDEADNAVTAQRAIDAINLTAAAMESLYDATTVAKTHVGLKE